MGRQAASLALRGRAPQLARQRTLMVATFALLWFGIAVALSGAAPNYSEWSAPVKLGSTINTTSAEFNPALSKDGLSLYFDSNRPGGFGGSDIYVSQRDSVD